MRVYATEREPAHGGGAPFPAPARIAAPHAAAEPPRPRRLGAAGHRARPVLAAAARHGRHRPGPDERARADLGAARGDAGRGRPAGGGVRRGAVALPAAAGAAHRRATADGRGAACAAGRTGDRAALPDGLAASGFPGVSRQNRHRGTGPGCPLELAGLLRRGAVRGRGLRGHRSHRGAPLVAYGRTTPRSGTAVPAAEGGAGELAGEVVRSLAVRAVRLGRPGLLLPAGVHLPPLPRVRGDPAGVVPRPPADVGSSQARRGGGTATAAASW